ncbi:MAG: hypothetical protein VKK04_11930 [Synechococcales bacterium]|nr:hypothetical protein [Synechococcales bacterium]
MIISHKHRFIFIKTKKTAGTSLEVFLSQHCGDRDVVTPISPPVPPHQPQNHEGYFNPLPEIFFRYQDGRNLKPVFEKLQKRERFYNHLPGYLIRTRVSRSVWQNYFKFCVERNPWDKTISFYYMLQRSRRDPEFTFDDYLALGNFCLNYPYYMDAEGKKVIVDRVLHYENLNQELAEVFDQLGIPFDGSLGVWAKSNNRKDRRPYQEFYTAEQRDRVTEAFQKEIELHGYQF